MSDWIFHELGIELDVTEPKSKTAAVEDGIMVSGAPVNAGSRMLEGIISPIEADCVSRLRDSGEVSLRYITRAPEFGLAGWENESEDVPGAVSAVADGAVDFALARDLFGELGRAAISHGQCYLRPSFGTVSRYGLVPIMASGDQVGVCAPNVESAFGALELIAGYDARDSLSLERSEYVFSAADTEITVGIPESAPIRRLAEKFPCRPIELSCFELMPHILQTILSAEFTGNASRYDGLRYGYRAENTNGLDALYNRSRTEGFGSEAKLALVTGALVLSADYYDGLYDRALRLRRIIAEETARIFETVRVIALPTDMENASPFERCALYALAPLAGLPALSLPYSGGGLTLFAAPGDENAILTLAERLVD